MVFIVSYQYSVVSIQTLRVQNYYKNCIYANLNAFFCFSEILFAIIHSQ